MKRVSDTPGHPYYGPVRRMWVIMAQLDLLRVGDVWVNARGDDWEKALIRIMKCGLSESYAQRAVLSHLISEEDG